jgi:hypothetical protein
LELYLDIGGAFMTQLPVISADIQVHHLLIQGASWESNSNHLIFSDDLYHPLPVCTLKWRLKSLRLVSTSSSAISHLVAVPIYTSENRKTFVSQVLVQVAPPTIATIGAMDTVKTSTIQDYWAQRSVAILLHTSLT